MLESLQNEGKSFREATRITNQVVFQLESTGTLTADIERENNALAKYTEQDLRRLIEDIEPKV